MPAGLELQMKKIQTNNIPGVPPLINLQKNNQNIQDAIELPTPKILNEQPPNFDAAPQLNMPGYDNIPAVPNAPYNGKTSDEFYNIWKGYKMAQKLVHATIRECKEKVHQFTRVVNWKIQQKHHFQRHSNKSVHDSPCPYAPKIGTQQQNKRQHPVPDRPTKAVGGEGIQ